MLANKLESLANSEVEKVRHALLLKDALTPSNKDSYAVRRSKCSSKEEKVRMHKIFICFMHLSITHLMIDGVLF